MLPASTDDSAHLARLRAIIGAGQPLPRDLASWVLDMLALALPAAERRRLRDEAIRRAASHLAGSTWERARRLAASARRGHGPGAAGDVALALREARTFAELPESPRQYHRVLAAASPIGHRAGSNVTRAA